MKDIHGQQISFDSSSMAKDKQFTYSDISEVLLRLQEFYNPGSFETPNTTKGQMQAAYETPVNQFGINQVSDADGNYDTPISSSARNTDDVDYLVEKIKFLSKRIKKGQNIIGMEVDEVFDKAYEQWRSGSAVAINGFNSGSSALTEDDSEEKKQDSDYWKKNKRVDKRNQGNGRDPIGADRYLPKQPFSTERNLDETMSEGLPKIGGALAVPHRGQRIHISKIVQGTGFGKMRENRFPFHYD